MFIDQIRERFRNGSYPMTVELSNGRKLRVPHVTSASLGAVTDDGLKL